MALVIILTGIEFGVDMYTALMFKNVRNLYNPIMTAIPETGQLMELTVPYSPLLSYPGQWGLGRILQALLQLNPLGFRCHRRARWPTLVQNRR